jgi:hypothetical protein
MAGVASAIKALKPDPASGTLPFSCPFWLSRIEEPDLG